MMEEPGVAGESLKQENKGENSDLSLQLEGKAWF